jgi:exopolyphosphatase/guanosine-5'-triphosphate,3'-diphosphate pyrophosphatase
MPKIAVIDIGSNSIRMQMSSVLGKSYKIIEDYKELLRVGDDVFLNGYFSSNSIDEMIIVLKKIKSLMEGKNIEIIRAVATAAFREAKNAGEIVQKIKEVIGIDVEIISGEFEAYLNYLSAAANFQLTKIDAIIVDIGGGSTEICLTKGGKLDFGISTNLGCSKLTKDFIKHDPPVIDEIFSLKKHINNNLKHYNIPRGVNAIICSGGTMYNVSEIYYKQKDKEDTAIKYVDRKFLKNLISTMEWKKVEDRTNIYGIEPKRADIMLAAMLFVDILLEKSHLSGFYTQRAGLRTGLTIDTMNKMGVELPFQNGDDVRFSRLIEIGNKFSFEEDHARHVNKLAKIIFESLKAEMQLDNKYKSILEAACILHDIGNYIGYTSHHKHSYYLIKNSELIGYTAEEIELIANIARYHRRSVPKQSHEPYNNLGINEKTVMRKLAGILRVADGFDRSHNAFINDIKVEIGESMVRIKPLSEADIYLEIEGANSKKDLLEASLNKKVIIE